jgi:uncharacterized protein
VQVQVACVAPGLEALVTLEVATGATVEDAVTQSGIVPRIGVPPTELAYAIFGRRAEADARLAEGDRVEITRPLACDPKLARRRRASGSA